MVAMKGRTYHDCLHVVVRSFLIRNVAFGLAVVYSVACGRQ